MYFLLSPAKNLDEKIPVPIDVSNHYSQPTLIKHTSELMSHLKHYDAIDLQELMNISAKIAQTNVMRNQAWVYPFADNAKPAVYLFAGDVYTGLDAHHLSQNEILYLNKHLGILSGLYGLLKPLDLIMAYRLEMGTKFKTPHANDLYEFWQDIITDLVNERIQQSGSNILINLASNEYYSAINPKKINATIITPKFFDQKNGQYKIISLYAKKARGMMVNFASKHGIVEPQALKTFDTDGYYFDEYASDEHTWIFKRDERW